jgi:photosystem II stability/assembly factor-like uncharacterized protein
MANTGFTTPVNGVETDLIKIFAPLSGTKLTYNTNFVTSTGLDLKDIFEPYVAGDDTAVITKYTTLSGGLEKDLNVIFAIPPPPYPTASNVFSIPSISRMSMHGKNVLASWPNSSNVWYSTNYGKTFSPSGFNLSSGGFYGLTSYGTYAIISTSSTGSAVYTSSNSGANWIKRMNIAASYMSCCSMYENYAMVTINNTIIYLSNDYGASWSSISVVNASFRGCAISYDSTSNKYIAVCCSNEVTPCIYYCTNFTGVSSTTTFTKGTTNISSFENNSISLVGRNGIAVSNAPSYLGLWYTKNGGQTWTKSVNYSTLDGFNRCSLSANGLGIAMRTNIGSVTPNDYTQYVTRDYGVTWTNAQIFPSGTYSYAFAIYNNILVSGTSTTNNLVHWGTYS